MNRDFILRTGYRLATGLERHARRFRRDTRAGVVVLFGLGLPAVSLAGVGAMEYADVFSTRQALQAIADSAALNGARGLGIDRSSATAERTKIYADTLADKLRDRWRVTSAASTDADFKAMTVTETAIRPSLFGDLIAPGGFQIHATATAINSASVPLCVLGSESADKNVVRLKNSSALLATKCMVQSNNDLTTSGNAKVTASAIRSAGDASGALMPSPVTDAPAIADPFASLPIDVPKLCTDLNIQLLSGTRTLNPGVHCGNIQVLGNGTLILNPGEHYFVGLGLTVGGNVSIVGSDVTLIFKGMASAAFTQSASLQLEGRKSGPYAGFVLIADRSFSGTLSVSTKNAKKLLGTIYLPNGTLAVSGVGNKVADQSAWTVVVAKKINVSGSAELYVNSDYGGSPVPVPPGVGPGTIRLVN